MNYAVSYMIQSYNECVCLCDRKLKAMFIGRESRAASSDFWSKLRILMLFLMMTSVSSLFSRRSLASFVLFCVEFVLLTWPRPSGARRTARSRTGSSPRRGKAPKQAFLKKTGQCRGHTRGIKSTQ